MNSNRINSKQLIEIIKYYDNSKYMIIDIRENEEYAKNHIPYAVNIEFDKIMQISENSQVIPKEKNVIVYCERGGSSIYAANYLIKKGYKVQSLIGGIIEYRKN